MGSSSERSSAPKSQLISRRTLVRAGATAAWAVPVIQVVGAAPASAACSGALTVGGYGTRSGSNLTVTVSVTNNRSAALTGLIVTLDFGNGTWKPTATDPSGGDWKKTASSNKMVQFTKQSNLASCGGSSTFTAVIGVSVSGTASIALTAQSGAVTANGAISI